MKQAQPQYDALVCLGKNWQHKRESRRTRKYYPSVDTTRTAIAGGVLFKEGIAKKIIFSTGHTIEGGPTEARVMKEQLRSVFSEKEIPNSAIILDESDDSIDTAGNARSVKKIAIKNGYRSMALVTTWRHQWRAKKNFLYQEVPITSVKVTEDVLKSHGIDVSRGILGRIKVILESFIEILLFMTSLVDPEGNLLRKMTRHTRH